jgi:hypothetical protein
MHGVQMPTLQAALRGQIDCRGQAVERDIGVVQPHPLQVQRPVVSYGCFGSANSTGQRNIF